MVPTCETEIQTIRVATWYVEMMQKIMLDLVFFFFESQRLLALQDHSSCCFKIGIKMVS